MRRSKAITFMVFVLLVCLLVGSCSSSKKDDGADSLQQASTLPDSKGLNAAAKILAQAIIDANGDVVFAQISTNCQAKISRTEVTRQLKTARAYLTTFLGANMDDFTVKSIETRNLKKGESGQARYTIVVKGDSRKALAKFQEEGGTNSNTSTTSPSSDETTTTTEVTLPFDEPTDWFDFVYEGSTWKLESCEEFLAASGLVPGNKISTTTTTSK